jgi:hypothetical protein
MTAKRSSPSNAHLCKFPFADGRKCRMIRHHDHPSLCIFHARAELQLKECDRLGAELAATLTGDFMTATDVNFVLGKLFTALAQNRIPARNAHTLAYIAQLMLASHPNLKKEYDFVYKYEQWNRMLDKAPKLSNSSPHSPNQEASNEHSNDDDAADENTDNNSDANEHADNDPDTDDSDNASDDTSDDSSEEAPDDLAADSKRIKLLQ